MSASTLPYLSDNELREIANPLRQPAAIVRWFKREGFEVRTKPNGMPLISRTNFDLVMSGHAVTATESSADAGNTPNVAAFLSRFRKDVDYGHGPTKKK
jgi:hypothetical protein